MAEGRKMHQNGIKGLKLHLLYTYLFYKHWLLPGLCRRERERKDRKIAIVREAEKPGINMRIRINPDPRHLGFSWVNKEQGVSNHDAHNPQNASENKKMAIIDWLFLKPLRTTRSTHRGQGGARGGCGWGCHTRGPGISYRLATKSGHSFIQP